MTGFDQTKDSQHHDRVSAARIDRAKRHNTLSPSSRPTIWRLSGNQAAQRFAQSCPARLPSPGVCLFGGVCHTCPAQVPAKQKIGLPGNKYTRQEDQTLGERKHSPGSAQLDHIEKEKTKYHGQITDQITMLTQRNFTKRKEQDQVIPTFNQSEGLDMEKAELISSTVVRHSNGFHDGQFPFILRISDIPPTCDTLRVEQFIGGTFTQHDRSGTSSRGTGCEIAQHKNSLSRSFSSSRFGNICDDLLPGMRPGPRPIANFPNARCTPRQSAVSYLFLDAPGQSYNFGDAMRNRRIYSGTTFNLVLIHKLWRVGETNPIYIKAFQLVGEHREGQPDTRNIIEQ